MGKQKSEEEIIVVENIRLASWLVVNGVNPERIVRGFVFPATSRVRTLRRGFKDKPLVSGSNYIKAERELKERMENEIDDWYSELLRERLDRTIESFNTDMEILNEISEGL